MFTRIFVYFDGRVEVKSRNYRRPVLVGRFWIETINLPAFIVREWHGPHDRAKVRCVIYIKNDD